VRTDLPFRTLCRWLAVIPLAIPSYIGAMSYIALLGPVGSVNTWLSTLIGAPQQWANIYGFWGGVFVLGLFTYPFIFLLVSAVLEATNPSVEETARSLGESPLGVFRRVTLPMLRPSILAGGLLAFLYALSDFGSPSLLRVQVFTTAIYHQLNTRFDQAAAALLSFVLVLITIAVLVGQQILLQKRSYVTITGTARLAPPLHHRPAYAAPHRRAAVRHYPDRLRDPGHRPRFESDPPVQHLRPMGVWHGRGPRRGLSDPLPDPVGPGRGRGARRHQPAPGRSGPLARRIPVARAAPHPHA